MADGNRRIAIGLYERAGRSEKKQASEFFEKLKSKRDGKIRVVEFKRGVKSGLSKEKVFNQLDFDRDGFLDFEDVLVLFYYSVKNAITILRCGGCSTLIFGPAYSCFKCFFNSADDRFALCRDCYATGNVGHRHPLGSSSLSTSTPADFLRDQALLIKFSDLISAHPSTFPSKKDLKKLWKDAKSQIGAASPAVEAMACNYFESMRSNNSLDIQKFSSTLTKQQEAFLTPRPDSDPATNYMKNALAMKLRSTPATAYATGHVAHHTASSSTPQTRYAHHPSSYRPNPQPSSNALSPMKVATNIFKIVEMALAIGSLSSMCTIM